MSPGGWDAGAGRESQGVSPRSRALRAAGTPPAGLCEKTSCQRRGQPALSHPHRPEPFGYHEPLGANGAVERGTATGNSHPPLRVGSRACAAVPKRACGAEHPQGCGNSPSRPWGQGADAGGAGSRGGLAPVRGCNKWFPTPSPSTKASLRANTSPLQRLLRDMCLLLFAPKANFARKRLWERGDSGAEPSLHPHRHPGHPRGRAQPARGEDWGPAGAPGGAGHGALQEGQEPSGKGLP